MSDLYTLPVRTLAGKDTDLSAYKGHVLLIVNTASQCGFTPHYAGLETLYRQYKDQGLVVLGFPCNQFGAQEPGSAADIAVLRVRNEESGFLDVAGQRRFGKQALECEMTLLAGKVVFDRGARAGQDF